jgi:hypothetical protein
MNVTPHPRHRPAHHPGHRPAHHPGHRPALRPGHRPTRRWAIASAAAAVAVVVVVSASCAGSIVHNYRTFQSALDRGASCSELYDQRARFDDEDTLAKIDRDLAEIGCTSQDATRTDD